jgi:hypothetical protein
VVKHKDKPRNISPEHFHFDKNEFWMMTKLMWW